MGFFHRPKPYFSKPSPTVPLWHGGDSICSKKIEDIWGEAGQRGIEMTISDTSSDGGGHRTLVRVAIMGKKTGSDVHYGWMVGGAEGAGKLSLWEVSGEATISELIRGRNRY